MAWLITSLATASRYSSGAAFSSSTVLTTMGSLTAVSSDERFGVEGFEVGGEVGELVRKLGAEILCQRAAGLDAGDGSRLAEQEHFAAAHTQQLAGDGLAGRRAERRHQIGDMMRADLECALLVGFLRLVGRLDDVGDARARERRHGVGGDLRTREVHRRHAREPEQAGLGAGIGCLAEVSVEAGRRHDIDDAAPVVATPFVAAWAAAARLALVAHHR